MIEGYPISRSRLLWRQSQHNIQLRRLLCTEPKIFGAIFDHHLLQSTTSLVLCYTDSST